MDDGTYVFTVEQGSITIRASWDGDGVDTLANQAGLAEGTTGLIERSGGVWGEPAPDDGAMYHITGVTDDLDDEHPYAQAAAGQANGEQWGEQETAPQETEADAANRIPNGTYQYWADPEDGTVYIFEPGGSADRWIAYLDEDATEIPRGQQGTIDHVDGAWTNIDPWDDLHDALEATTPAATTVAASAPADEGSSAGWTGTWPHGDEDGYGQGQPGAGDEQNEYGIQSEQQQVEWQMPAPPAASDLSDDFYGTGQDILDEIDELAGDADLIDVSKADDDVVPASTQAVSPDADAGTDADTDSAWDGSESEDSEDEDSEDDDEGGPPPPPPVDHYARWRTVEGQPASLQAHIDYSADQLEILVKGTTHTPVEVTATNRMGFVGPAWDGDIRDYFEPVAMTAKIRFERHRTRPNEFTVYNIREKDSAAIKDLIDDGFPTGLVGVGDGGARAVIEKLIRDFCRSKQYPYRDGSRVVVTFA